MVPCESGWKRPVSWRESRAEDSLTPAGLGVLGVGPRQAPVIVTNSYKMAARNEPIMRFLRAKRPFSQDESMARAKRHYVPGYIWHITHRCHKREFLLKFSKDRHRYLQWLYQARKRYGLSILNYMVTANHVHVLVSGGGEGFQLREEAADYRAPFEVENDDIGPKTPSSGTLMQNNQVDAAARPQAQTPAEVTVVIGKIVLEFPIRALRST